MCWRAVLIPGGLVFASQVRWTRLGMVCTLGDDLGQA